ncbi:hypothetical protein [Methylomagnum sp.]
MLASGSTTQHRWAAPLAPRPFPLVAPALFPIRPVSVCVGCGCDDLHACFDESTHLPCHWVRLDEAAGKGVCSCCLDWLPAWDGGGREFRGCVIALQEAADGNPWGPRP